MAVTSGLVSVLSPIVERHVDRLPEKALLAGGLTMVFLGFLFQSLQYVAALTR